MATVIGAALLALSGWWTVGGLAVLMRRCPPMARLRGRDAATVAAECRLARRLLAGRIEASEYRNRMSGLAAGQGKAVPRRA
jgi:hypothetical protein